MTADDENIDEGDLDWIAFEIALGGPDVPNWEQLNQKMRNQPLLAAKVKHWQMQLAPMLEDVPEEPAPASVWAQIQQQMNEQITVEEHTSGDVRAASPARDPVVFWRSAAVAMGTLAATACLALIVVPMHILRSTHPKWVQQESNPSRTQPPTPAQIQQDNVAPAPNVTSNDASPDNLIADFSLTVLPDGTIPLTSIDPGHVLQCWLVGPDAKPRPAAVITPDDQQRYRLRPNLYPQITPVDRIFVSIEPRPAPRDGRPTGQLIRLRPQR